MTALSAAIAGNAALTSLRLIVTMACGLATSVLLARALGPPEFGTYRLALTIIWVIEVTTVLALPSAAMKFVAEASGAGSACAAGGIARVLLAWASVIFLVVLVPFVLLHERIALFYHDPSLGPLLLLGVAGVLPGVWAGILAAVLQGQQRFRHLSSLTVVQAVLGMAATAVLLSAGAGLRALFLLWALLNVVQLVMTWAVLGREIAVGVCPPALRGRMRRYAAVMGAIALVGAVVWERSEVFFLGRFTGTTDVAFYSLAFTVALNARRLVPAAIGEVLFPVIARLEGMRDDWGVANAWLHATRYLAMLGFPLAVGGVVLAEPVMAVLFGDEYRPAAPVLAVLMVGAGVVALSHPAAAVLFIKERFGFLMTLSAVLAAVNVALDLWLIPRWAALGAAVANSAVQTTAALVQGVFAAGLVGARFPFGNLGRCLLAAGLAFGPAFALRAWPLWEGLADTALSLAAFVLLYPVALTTLGAMLPEDVERLRAVLERLPRPLRRVLAGVSRGLGAGVR